MKVLLLMMLSLSLFESQVFAVEHLDQLAEVSTFAFGGNGVAGKTADGEILFKAIYAKPDAKSEFLQLLKSGNIQAKCYSMVALRKLDPEAYRAARANFEEDEHPVSTIGGCIIMILPMRSVFWNIDRGNYDRYFQSDRE